MAAISRMIFSDAFSWMKTFIFWFKFHWSLFLRVQLHQPWLWFITGGYLVKRWFLPAAARARGQSNDLNREILASNLFNWCKEVINAPPVPSISRCIHIVYQHKNVWEYLHYVHCKDALLNCSAPGGERCESLTWVDEIGNNTALVYLAIISTNADLINWRIYGALGGDELTQGGMLHTCFGKLGHH